MTTPSDDRQQIAGARFYPPVVEGGDPLISVTTALDVLSKGEGMLRWSANSTTDAAMADPGRIVNATVTPPCGRKKCSSHDWRTTCSQCPCGKCEPCTRQWLATRYLANRERRADEGTDVHHVLATWAQQGVWLATTDQLAGYVDSIRHWVRDYGVTPDDVRLSEARVANLNHGYAGTLDLVVDIHANRTDRTARMCAFYKEETVTLLADLKTREREGSEIYPVSALQTSGYRHATHIVDGDGTLRPMIPVHGCCVLHVEPGRYVFRPVGVHNPDGAFEAFLSAMGLARFLWAEGSSLVAYSSDQVMLPSPRLESEDGSVPPKPPKPATKKRTTATGSAAATPRKRATAPAAATTATGQVPTIRSLIAASASATAGPSGVSAPSGDYQPGLYTPPEDDIPF